MENLNSELNSMVKRIAREVIGLCASSYNFDEDEAMGKVSQMLNINLEKKRKTASSALVEEIVEEKEKRLKSAFPLPFNGERQEGRCEGLRHNHHQYTQCESNRMKGEVYCKTCKSQAVKNVNGLPTYGTIEGRLACGIFDFKDPSGLKPKPYSWVMKKLKLNEKAVEDEAERLGVRLLKEHFEVPPPPVKSNKKKPAATTEEKKDIGRPKKTKSVVFAENCSSGGGDLFKELAKVAKKSQEAPPAMEIEKEKEKEKDVASDDSSSSSSDDDDDEEEKEHLRIKEQKRVLAAAEQKRVQEQKRIQEQKRKDDELFLLAEQKRKDDELFLLAEQKRKDDELFLLAEQKRKDDELFLLAAEQKGKDDAAEKKKRDERKKEKKESALKAEALKAEALKAEALKAEALKAEALKAEALKAEALKAEALKAEALKAEALKAEALKAEALKAEALKAEALKEAAAKDETAAAAPIERVKRVHHLGKQFLRSLTTGIVYTLEKERVGTWDEDDMKIVFDPVSDESSEEEEDEYDR
jgi:hypothetical protein